MNDSGTFRRKYSLFSQQSGETNTIPLHVSSWTSSQGLGTQNQPSASVGKAFFPVLEKRLLQEEISNPPSIHHLISGYNY